MALTSKLFYTLGDNTLSISFFFVFCGRWVIVKNLKTLVLSALLFASASEGAMRQYSATVESSNWEVSSTSRLKCTLNHALPGYGEAMFTSMASKQLNMEFELDMYLLPNKFDIAAVYSVPPKWMPGEAPKTIADMRLRKQYNGDLPQDAAWTMLSELEKGFWPTIYYQDWYNKYDKVAVALNASNFSGVYREFVQCVSNLLPFGFDDISYTVLSYQKNSTGLSKYSQKRLTMIGEYLKEDSDMELVLLDGYTDSYGGRWNNEQLSIRRANEVKNYLTTMGVPEDRIQVTGHGERRHSAPNDTRESRAQNRRVVVRLSKS